MLKFLYLAIFVSFFTVSEAQAQAGSFFESLFGNSPADRESSAETHSETQTEAQSDAVCTTCMNNLYRENSNQSDLRSIRERVGENFSSNPWADLPGISNYSESSEVESMIATAMKRKRARTRRLCYKYVKDAMLAAGLADYRPPGKYAKYGVRDLKAQGFTNLLDHSKYKKRIDGPGSAPKGAILVYSKGKGAGHVEIKTDHGTNGGYVSDYWNNESILQDELSGMAAGRYKLIGVMVKLKGDQ